MRSFELSSPVEVRRVSIRRLSGADLIAVGAHVAVLSSLPDGQADEHSRACAASSMVSIAGLVTGLGEAAGMLEFRDLLSVVELAMDSLMQSEMAATAKGLV